MVRYIHYKKRAFYSPFIPTVTHLIPHVWLTVKACWRAEDLAVCIHALQLVSSGVHGIHGSLQQVQTLVARGLQTILCRQVGSQSASQACMET